MSLLPFSHCMGSNSCQFMMKNENQIDILSRNSNSAHYPDNPLFISRMIFFLVYVQGVDSD